MGMWESVVVGRWLKLGDDDRSACPFQCPCRHCFGDHERMEDGKSAELQCSNYVVMASFDLALHAVLKDNDCA